MKLAFLVLILAVIAAPASASNRAGSEATATLWVEATAPFAEVDTHFLSATVDAAYLIGADLWNFSSTPFNFSQPQFVYLASQLAPAFLRIGGTDADLIYYNLTTEEPMKTLPPGYSFTLTRPIWNGVLEFLEATGLELVFGLNGGPGPRVGSPGQAWTTDNARGLLEYTVAQGKLGLIAAFELGNEPNLFLDLLHLNLSYSQLGKDFVTLKLLLEEFYGDQLIIGPDGAAGPTTNLTQWDEMLQEFLQYAEDVLDAITWHYYPMVSERGGTSSPHFATIARITDPVFLNSSYPVAAATVQQAAGTGRYPEMEVWVGETGSAAMGGQPGVSNTFADGFWYLNTLGYMAANGQRVVIRQTLTGFDYGLINATTLEPCPDYYSALLWKRLMGTSVLAVAVNVTSSSVDENNATEYVRAYAHCSHGNSGGVAFVMINLLPTPVKIDIELIGQRSILGKHRHEYHLTADALDSFVMHLNGKELQLSEDGKLPALDPVVASTTEPIVIAPLSYSFFEFPEAKLDACVE